MRLWGLVAVLPLALSCREHQPDPRLAPTPAPSAAPPAAPAVVPEWVPSDAARMQSSLGASSEAPDGGRLLSGQRIGERGVAPQVASPALTGGARVPKSMGGGFLFFSPSALYFAKTFLADLEPLVSPSSPPIDISFGPGYAIVHQASGARVALGWPGKRPVPMPVVGLIDVGALPDGRSVLVVEPDLVLTRAAGQQAWRDVSSSAREVRQLHATGTTLWLARAEGKAARVEADGSLSHHASLPADIATGTPKLTAPGWPPSVSDTPLTRAVRRGVPLDERTALVEAAGAFGKVDLTTGTLIGISGAVLANARECELLPLGSDVLALCRNRDSTHVVVSGAGSAAPKIERSFGTQGQFFTGSPDTLLFGGACDGRAPSQPTVCVRQRDGTWRELGGVPGATSGDGGTPPPPIARWLPTPEGGAVGLTAAGLYDPTTGTTSAFSANPRPTDHALFHPHHQLLVDDFAIADDGRLVGYEGAGSVVLSRDGMLERSPQRFASLRAAGALALATDPEHRLWQSTDFGRRWSEVSRPPGTDSRQALSIAGCSRVGCEVSGWVRVGFRPSQPRVEQLRTAERPAAFPPAKLPRLSCQRSSPPRTRWETRLRAPDGDLTEEFDFGARKVPARQDSLVAVRLRFDGIADELSLGATLLDAALADSAAGGFRQAVARRRAVRFVELLGDPRIVESRLTWQEVLAVAARESNEAAAGIATDERNALPVMGEAPASSAGLLMLEPNGVLLWLRPGQPAMVAMLGRESADFTPQSALALGKNELVVLAEDSSCAARILSLTSAGARTLSELPPRARRASCTVNPDALARLDEGGFAVLRMPSAEPPTKDDPALLLTPHAHRALAPWATLTACSADAKGARATIAVQSRWLDVDVPGLNPSGDSFVLAQVRWSESRVCLEAIALDAPVVSIGDQALPTAVVARFGATPRADRRGFALGAEHTEDLACALLP